jgi:hypothetical protein
VGTTAQATKTIARVEINTPNRQRLTITRLDSGTYSVRSIIPGSTNVLVSPDAPNYRVALNRALRWIKHTDTFVLSATVTLDNGAAFALYRWTDGYRVGIDSPAYRTVSDAFAAIHETIRDQ